MRPIACAMTLLAVATGVAAAADTHPPTETLPLRPAPGIKIVRLADAPRDPDVDLAEIDRLIDAEMAAGLPAPAPSVVVSPQNAAARATVELPLDQWTVGPPVPPFAYPRMELDIWGKFGMQPNSTTPNNSFGWIDGPVITVQPAENSLPGNLFGLRVTFLTPNPGDIIGETPTLRFRLGTVDDKRFEMSGATPLLLKAQGGELVATVTFDRSLLTAPTQVRPSIDFINVWYGSEFVDPNFLIFITKVEAFTTTASAATPTPTPTPTPTATPTPTSGPSGSKISAAYMENDKDLYVHINGSSNRTLIREDVDSYAYDGAVIAVIDNERLYAYDANDGFTRVTIEEDSGDDVIAVAVAGRWIIYMEDDGRVRGFDMATRIRTDIVEDNADGVSSAGDGLTLHVLDLHNFGFDLYQVRPSVDYDLEELVGDGDALFFRTRSSRNYN